MAGCGSDSPEDIDCGSILPAEESGFAELSNLLISDCGGCHNSTVPVFGYDYQTRPSAFESTAYKARNVYAQLVSGKMPLNGDAWSEDNLKLFRSWYCHGGFYE